MSRAVDKRAKLRRALVLLERMYGRRAWARRGSGLDVLVKAMLAQNTNMANATRGYRMLRRRFPTWARVLAAPVGDVQREIAVCGLSRTRARRLQDLLARVKRERGRLDIGFLAGTGVREALDYLTGFYGIGPRTAAFTLLFAFDSPVLPVDNGILRVLRRTRLVRPKARDAEAGRAVSPLLPPGRHYAAHTLLFAHAKQRCRPRNPKCGECRLLELCPFGKRRVRHEPPETSVGLAEARLLRRPGRLARFASEGLSKRADDAERARAKGRAR